MINKVGAEALLVDLIRRKVASQLIHKRSYHFEMGKFLRALRDQRKKAVRELLYLYNIEELPDAPGEDKRLHHHAVISCEGEPEETLRALWGRGSVHIEPLLDGPDDSFEARARYLVKERHPGAFGRKTGAKGWIGSRNLKKPVSTSELVPDTVTVAAPPGAYVLDRDSRQNAFGAFTFIKYLLPETPRRTHRRD